MKLFAIVQRIVLVVILFVMAFVAPLWVLALFVCVASMFVSVFVEGIVLVMMAEYLARDFVGYGIIGWSCLLWLVACESRRANFRIM